MQLTAGLSLPHRLWRSLPRGPRRLALAVTTGWLAPRAGEAIMPTGHGVIVVGELARASGLGEGARLMLAALARQGVPAVGIDSADRRIPDLSRVDKEGLAPIVLHVNAPELPRLLMRLPRSLLRGRRIIGYWAWELPVVPPRWAVARACVHEVWCPSEFTAAAVAPVAPGKPRIVRHPVACLDVPVSTKDRAAFDLPDNALVVLVSFSLASSFVRKNPLAAIAAFRQAFGDRPDRVLLLKIGHVADYGADLAQVRAAIGDARNIRLDTTLYSGPDSRALLRCCDIVMSLHRSEGFGLVVAEAMLEGKCVVATDASATREFLDESCGLPVRARDIPARDPRGVFEAQGAIWADADIPHAVQCLRHAAEDPGLRLRLGAAARARARTMFDGADLRAALTTRSIKERRILVWQWGRRGGGPRFGADLARGLSYVPGVVALLSLSDRAEILNAPGTPPCAMTVATYDNMRQFLWQLARWPWAIGRLRQEIRRLKPDLAICAMPGPLDLLMVAALGRERVPTAVIVHDAHAHPGDGLPMQITLQRLLVAACGRVVALSGHVARDLQRQRFLMRGRRVRQASLPPFMPETPLAETCAAQPPAPLAHGGVPRLLMFGRLLPYKGIDLLGPALTLLRARHDVECRVIGQGPQTLELDVLYDLPNVHVENAWVAEGDIAKIVAWADVLVLPYREASQSGVGAVAIASGRYVVATRVGGLVEQFANLPQAVLCAPDPVDIARAIADLLDAPPRRAALPDARAAWATMAQTLIAELGVKK